MRPGEWRSEPVLKEYRFGVGANFAPWEKPSDPEWAARLDELCDHFPYLPEANVLQLLIAAQGGAYIAAEWLLECPRARWLNLPPEPVSFEGSEAGKTAACPQVSLALSSSVTHCRDEDSSPVRADWPEEKTARDGKILAIFSSG